MFVGEPLVSNLREGKPEAVAVIQVFAIVVTEGLLIQVSDLKSWDRSHRFRAKKQNPPGNSFAALLGDDEPIGRRQTEARDPMAYPLSPWFLSRLTQESR